MITNIKKTVSDKIVLDNGNKGIYNVNGRDFK